MGQVVRAALVKEGNKLMLKIDPIQIGDVASVKPDADGTASRATMLYATNRSTGKDGQIVIPVKGFKDDAAYVAVTLSGTIEAVKALGLRFAIKDTSRAPGKVKVTKVPVASLNS